MYDSTGLRGEEPIEGSELVRKVYEAQTSRQDTKLRTEVYNPSSELERMYLYLEPGSAKD